MSRGSWVDGLSVGTAGRGGFSLAKLSAGGASLQKTLMLNCPGTDITDAVSPYDSESGAHSGMTSNSSASLVAS